jgi:hypothetical protein
VHSISLSIDFLLNKNKKFKYNQELLPRKPQKGRHFCGFPVQYPLQFHSRLSGAADILIAACAVDVSRETVFAAR